MTPRSKPAVNPISDFQTFEDASAPGSVASRVGELRAWLAHNDLEGVLVPRSDAFQGEYVAPGDERLAWLTGFTGSAGFAIVLRDRAALFIDGRYTIQVREQTDPAVFAPVDLLATPPSRWLRDHVTGDARIGYDPWLIDARTDRPVRDRARSESARRSCPLAINPIDVLWSDRPSEPQGSVTLHPQRLAGKSAADKLSRIRAALDGDDALLLSDPHAVAWAFNIRGADVSHTPLPHARALIAKTGRPTLYVGRAQTVERGARCDRGRRGRARPKPR